jgi:hypothetical protein
MRRYRRINIWEVVMSGWSVAQRLRAVTLPVLLVFSAAHAHAAAVSVASFSFAPGSGYGVDASEGSGSLLGVSFSSSLFSAQDFVLTVVGDSMTFDVGTVQFLEPNSNGGINANEVDNLGVAASLSFNGPFAGLVGVQATGAAIAGAGSAGIRCRGPARAVPERSGIHWPDHLDANGNDYAAARAGCNRCARGSGCAGAGLAGAARRRAGGAGVRPAAPALKVLCA